MWRGVLSFIGMWSSRISDNKTGIKFGSKVFDCTAINNPLR